MQELNAKLGLWFGEIQTNSGGKTKVPWWNHELKPLHQNANKAFHTAFKSRLTQD